MSNVSKSLFFSLLALAAWMAAAAVLNVSAARAQPGATPTFDPFVETPLPPHPTELEWGANLYWHWCMPCHGDHGQGLTDEFRGLWEEDHQNCWARGCHGGRIEDEGFPIPLVVPALADESRLARFPSRQALADYLQATHPPQSPGVLKRGEYQAIALFVWTWNNAASAPATPSPAPTLSPALEDSASRRGENFGLIGFGAAMLLALFVLFRAKKKT